MKFLDETLRVHTLSFRQAGLLWYKRRKKKKWQLDEIFGNTD
jgi:hypothetical protein